MMMSLGCAMCVAFSNIVYTAGHVLVVGWRCWPDICRQCNKPRDHYRRGARTLGVWTTQIYICVPFRGILRVGVGTELYCGRLVCASEPDSS